MWVKETMSIPESLLISLLGIVVVFMALVVLDLAVMVISRIVRLFVGAGGGTRGLSADEAAEREAEMLAVLAAAISEDLGLTPAEFRIKSIREL